MTKQFLCWFKGNFKTGNHTRYSGGDEYVGEKYLKLQIENSLRLGWCKEDIIIATNFPFENRGVKAIEMELFSETSAFQNKIPALNKVIQDGIIFEENIWSHDCDVIQLAPFNFPIIRGVGAVRHSMPKRNKIQGGSIFWGKDSYGYIKQLADDMIKKNIQKEESYLVRFFANKEFEYLNYTYNFFRASEACKKYAITDLPIRVIHLHPQYDSVWDVMVEAKNKLGIQFCDEEVVKLIKKYGLRR